METVVDGVCRILVGRGIGSSPWIQVEMLLNSGLPECVLVVRAGRAGRLHQILVSEYQRSVAWRFSLVPHETGPSSGAVVIIAACAKLLGTQILSTASVRIVRPTGCAWSKELSRADLWVYHNPLIYFFVYDRVKGMVGTGYGL